MSLILESHLADKGYEYITQVEKYSSRTSYSYAIGPRVDPYTGGVRMNYGTRVSGLTRYTEFFTAKKNNKISFFKCNYYIQDSDREFLPENIELLIKDSGNLVKKIYVTKNNGTETDIVRFALFEGNKNIMGYNFCESSVVKFDDTKYIDLYSHNEILSLTDGKLVVFVIDIPEDNGYSFDGENVKLGSVYLKQKEVIYDKDKIECCKKIDTEIDDGWESCKDSLRENVYLIKNKDGKYRVLGITRDRRLVMSDPYDQLQLVKRYILPPLTMDEQDPEAPYAYPDTGLVFNFVNGSDNGEFIVDEKLNQYHRNSNKLVLKNSVVKEN